MILESKSENDMKYIRVFDRHDLNTNPTIYHTRGEHANHYTTDVVFCCIYRNVQMLLQLCPFVRTIVH
jgi:hypothetical protein